MLARATAEGHCNAGRRFPISRLKIVFDSWVWKSEHAPSGMKTAYQVGVVSRGEGCAYRNQPGVFTDLDHFKDFIQEKAANGGCNKYN